MSKIKVHTVHIGELHVHMFSGLKMARGGPRPQFLASLWVVWPSL
jgi:hypothetical protein